MSALCFTGHRPESLPFGENELSAECLRLKAILLDEIMRRAEQGYDTFYCGAARGMDIIFGHQVLLVKALEHPEIKLVCVIPYEEQAKGWPEKWRDRYFGLLEQADDVVLLSNRYTCDCYQRRNRYMVDHSDAVLAVYNESGQGGTACTVAYAGRQGKEVVCINPNTLVRTG